MLAHGQWMLCRVFPPFHDFGFDRWPALAGREWPWRTRLPLWPAAWLLGHLATLAGLVHNCSGVYQSGQGLLYRRHAGISAGYGWG